MTNDTTEIGIGFNDGGGELSLDDFVLCKVSDATFTEAPPLPPLPGEDDDSDDNTVTPPADNNTKTDDNNIGNNTVNTGNNTYNNTDVGTSDGEDGEKSEPKPIYGKSNKKKVVYTDTVVTDWAIVGAIIGGVALVVVAGAVTLIIVIKKRKHIVG